MIDRYLQNNITWLDVQNPTQDEVYEILNECNIPREFGDDLATANAKGEVIAKKGFLKTSILFPIVKRTDIQHPHEVKFLVTNTHLVTIHFEDIGVLYQFAKEFEVLSLLNGKSKKTTPDQLFIVMLNHFYNALHGKLDYLSTKLSDIEDEIFKEHEREMVFELSHVSRRLISFRQTLSTHKGILSKLEDAMSTAFIKKHGASVEALLHHHKTVTGRMIALFSTFDNLRSTNNSLLTTKQNEVMKYLTIISFITFPLMLFSSMFGMNTEHTPLLGRPYDFWIIIGIMILVSVTLLIYFKYKKWL